MPSLLLLLFLLLLLLWLWPLLLALRTIIAIKQTPNGTVCAPPVRESPIGIESNRIGNPEFQFTDPEFRAEQNRSNNAARLIQSFERRCHRTASKKKKGRKVLSQRQQITGGGIGLRGGGDESQKKLK